MNVNNLVVSGWVQSDPEEASTKNNKRFARFRMMNYKKYFRADGSTGENKVFLDVVVWGDMLVDKVLDNVHKNIEVLVEGTLAISTFVDPDGRKKSRTECVARNVELVEVGIPPEAYQPQNNGGHYTPSPAPLKPQATKRVEVDDDDIPF
jgi:single-stranded DNA-binding protein